jgi:two-component system nitrogen regulation sensor histidine kinase GlnL
MFIDQVMRKDELQDFLLDNLSVSIVLLDKDLRVAYLSPSAESLLDTSLIRIIGEPVLNLLASDEISSLGAPVHLHSLKRALETNHPFTQREATLQLTEKSHIAVDLTASPIFFSSEKMLLLELHPIERLMQMNKEKELLSTHDAARNLVQGLAHEIKNPLGGIKGAAQLLSDDLKDQPELREFTGIICDETDRLCSLVDRLLGSNILPQFLSLNIHEVLEHVASLTEKEVAGSVTIDVQALSDNKTEIPTIWIKTRIERNFTIRNTNYKMTCCVEIIDNGPGVPAGLLDRIFFPMISGRIEGTGLGLSIAQSVIDTHHGLIKCVSKANKTIFYIYLPLDK